MIRKKGFYFLDESHDFFRPNGDLNTVGLDTEQGIHSLFSGKLNLGTGFTLVYTADLEKSLARVQKRGEVYLRDWKKYIETNWDTPTNQTYNPLWYAHSTSDGFAIGYAYSNLKYLLTRGEVRDVSILESPQIENEAYKQMHKVVLTNVALDSFD